MLCCTLGTVLLTCQHVATTLMVQQGSTALLAILFMGCSTTLFIPDATT